MLAAVCILSFTKLISAANVTVELGDYDLFVPRRIISRKILSRNVALFEANGFQKDEA